MESKKGFTLIELLVVIAIIALLLSIIMPSLKTVKELAAGIVCMSNEKQLSLSWRLYAEENNDKFCDAATPQQDRPNVKYRCDRVSGVNWCWVDNPRDESGGQRSETLDDKIRGFQNGALWRYLENPKVYHCPADKRYRDHNESTPAYINGYRTYSIGTVYSQRDNPSGNQDQYVIQKLTQIVNPAAKFVFLEEIDTEYAWNNNTWDANLNTSGTLYWADPLAALHNGASTFGFADGHAEKHKWVNTWTQFLFGPDFTNITNESNKRWPVINNGGSDTSGRTLPDVGKGGTAEDFWWFINAYIPGHR